MAKEGKRDYRGTWLDWPILWLGVVVFLAGIRWSGGSTPGLAWWLVALALAVAALARRGAFSPRR